MPRLPFTVDSALLRELGERLVGQAHIALAELIKNSYDADATAVEVTIDDDRIVVADNGHGMTREAFRDYWMRIGSPHKQGGTSPRLSRPLTGSKGIGRLAAQFLAHKIKIRTAAVNNPDHHLIAAVDWDEAVDAGDLTKATATWSHRPSKPGAFPDESTSGTRIELVGLKQEWDADRIEFLARELWPLQPPFRQKPGSEVGAFEIRLQAGDEEAEDRFAEQMSRVLDLWSARVVGKLAEFQANDSAIDTASRVLQVSVEFSDGTRARHAEEIDSSRIYNLDYEIRLFDLRYRQPYGIRVSAAREYLNRFGGVHVYDADFHLPYYGVETDWLRIEMDHSHRLSRSALLPEDLQVEEGLNFLPTNSRIYGVVNVDTGREHQVALKHGAGQERDALTIQVSRDRLVSNKAYEDLVRLVRFGVDFYAVTEAQRQSERRERRGGAETLPTRVERIEEVIDAHREALPTELYRTVRQELRKASIAIESEAERAAGRAALLGTLATAGISAVAFEHEFNRQVGRLERSTKAITRAAKQGDTVRVAELASSMQIVLKEARAARRIFTPVLDEQQRIERVRLKARGILKDVADQTRVYLRGVEIRLNEVDSSLRLPAGRPAEWSALFQNLFINAATAMLDADRRVLRARSREEGAMAEILLDDTGAGVDLSEADHLFEPFVRRHQISPERQRLGFGGTGLGLTIVRMLATNLGCQAQFVAPPSDWSTTMRIAWRSS